MAEGNDRVKNGLSNATIYLNDNEILFDGESASFDPGGFQNVVRTGTRGGKAVLVQTQKTDESYSSLTFDMLNDPDSLSALYDAKESDNTNVVKIVFPDKQYIIQGATVVERQEAGINSDGKISVTIQGLPCEDV